MSNVYLKAIGGDYDGDQVTVKSVFSQEANEEAEKKMNYITFLLGVEQKIVDKIQELAEKRQEYIDRISKKNLHVQRKRVRKVQNLNKKQKNIYKFEQLKNK